jgi:hypothetical protein
VHVEQSQWWASEKAMDGVTACERGAGAVQERVGCSSRQRRGDHRLRAGTSLVGNASGQKQAANGTSELYCVHYRAVEQWSSGSHPCQPTRRTLAGRAIGSPADEGEGVACAGPCTHRQRLLEACDSGFELAASTRGEALYSRHLSREALRLHVAAGGSGSIQHALVHIAQFTQVCSVAAMPLGQLEQCKYV